MTNFSTTRLSSKGQIVIPENIREQMGLKPGMEFVAVADKDVLVLKLLTPPDLGRFSRLIHRARFQARKAVQRKATRLSEQRKKKRR
jgi:AbrB family looped-hinge helix DNA binding protein